MVLRDNNPINRIKSTKSPFVIFLPFLIIYLILILIFASSGHHGDETRYLTYARNLAHGFYSPGYPYIDLGNGPGYPLVLVPFILLHTPLIYIQLMNGVFYYISIIFFFKSLRKITSFRTSIVLSLLWALYPTFYEEMPYILPEVFTSALIPVFLFTTIKSFTVNLKQQRLKYTFLCGIILGYLALTKPIFGYVLMVMIVIFTFLFIVETKNTNYRKSIGILLIALFTTVPYLAYTYSLTGKIFYWSSFGGNNLYWMSSPYPEETGSWIEYPPVVREDRIPGSEKLIILRHQKDFNRIYGNKKVQEANTINGQLQPNLTKGIEQDELFRQIAIENIQNHPLKFLENCLSNAGRILFNFPYSYVPEKPSTLFRLPINGTLIVFVLFSLLPTFMNWKKILFPIRFLLVIAFFYFTGSLLGSADSRMFVMIVPILMFWISYIFKRTISIKFNF